MQLQRNKNAHDAGNVNENDAGKACAGPGAGLSRGMFGLSADLVLAAGLVTLLAGFVKGAVGFAMPMIMISALGSFLPPDTALAAVILPTLASNLWQALRGGWRRAWAVIWRFRLYLSVMLVALALSAQLVRLLPQQALLLMIGVPITFFAVSQLLGWQPALRRRAWVEALVAAFAGFVGGLSGVWGPPLVAWLTAIGTPRREQMQVQGVVYSLAAVMLALAHLGSGVLNRGSLPLSALLVVPAVAGMALGLRLNDRLAQQAFRRATLVVLVLAGLNLIRRALIGQAPMMG